MRKGGVSATIDGAFSRMLTRLNASNAGWKEVHSYITHPRDLMLEGSALHNMVRGGSIIQHESSLLYCTPINCLVIHQGQDQTDSPNVSLVVIFLPVQNLRAHEVRSADDRLFGRMLNDVSCFTVEEVGRPKGFKLASTQSSGLRVLSSPGHEMRHCHRL